MTKRQLIVRLLMSEAEVDFTRFREGVLGDRDMRKLTRAASHIEDLRVFIDDSPVLSVSDISAKSRRLDREQKLTLIVVDYIQLIQGRGREERREQEVADISRSLKLLAKELNVPVIALSQLNRGPETRTNKRPMLADLRESGAIEQDADVVIFIYRDEVYDENSSDIGIAEVILAKQRNGPIGTVRLQFEGRYTRFNDLSEREAPPVTSGFDPDYAPL
jgi:replicative DNA helicase